MDILSSAGQCALPAVDDSLPGLAVAAPVALYAFRGASLVGANDAAWRLLGFEPGTSLAALLAALDPDRHLRTQLASLGSAPVIEPARHVARARNGRSPCLELHIGRTVDEPATRVVAAIDCTRWHGIESQLQRRLAFERLLTGASAQLIRAGGTTLDEAIVAVLGAVGMFFDVDRAYVFLIDDAAGTQSNTHEWVAAGISREAHNLQDVPLDAWQRA